MPGLCIYGLCILVREYESLLLSPDTITFLNHKLFEMLRPSKRILVLFLCRATVCLRMSHFLNLLGFSDSKIGYEKTKEKLHIGKDGSIQSKVNGKSFGMGHLEILSLRELRERVSPEPPKKSTFRHIENGGDVRNHLIGKICQMRSLTKNFRV